MFIYRQERNKFVFLRRKRADNRVYARIDGLLAGLREARKGGAHHRGASQADEQRGLGKHEIHRSVLEPAEEGAARHPGRDGGRTFYVRIGASGDAGGRAEEERPAEQSVSGRNQRDNHSAILFGIKTNLKTQ